MFYPAGTLGSGITTFFGDPGDNTMDIMGNSSIGVVFLVTYLFDKKGEEEEEEEEREARRGEERLITTDILSSLRLCW